MLEWDPVSRFPLSLAAVSVLAIASADADDRVLTLRFAPQEATGTTSVSLPEGVGGTAWAIDADDARGLDEPSVVGTGTDDDDSTFRWRTSSDLTAFVAGALRRTAEEWGLRHDPSAPRSLRGSIEEFRVVERNKPVGSSYEASVRLRVTVDGPAGGATSIGSATAQRWGRKHSGENASEVLSDALKAAFAAALGEGGLRSALAERAR